MAEYRFHTLWRFDAPLDEVWNAILDSPRWPQWWKGVEEVRELAQGDDSGVGSVQRYTWKGMLPYRLTFDMRITEVKPMVLLEGEASGELEGLGCWQFSRERNVTVVRYDWHVHTTKRWMNLMAPLARPLFKWNHDYLMDAGRHGLKHLLERRLSSSA
jgi:hypothetical protein